LAAIKEVERLNCNSDRGIYQIYGTHSIYGTEVLLYIGKADEGLGNRLFDVNHYDYYHVVSPDPKTLKIYLGRLSGSMTPNDKGWSEEIDIAEKLLIISNQPATNASGIKWLSDDIKQQAKNILVCQFRPI